jgi:ABC-type nitrate/sulfonate/bicarbonate transport system permease component
LWTHRACAPAAPGVYAGIILVLLMTGVHEALLRRLERKVATYREA